MQGATLLFFQRLVARLQPVSDDAKCEPHKMAQAAEFIREHCAGPLRLKDIASAVQLSPSYLIRAFKVCHGLTPHGYLIDCRLKLARNAEGRVCSCTAFTRSSLLASLCARYNRNITPAIRINCVNHGQ